MIGRATGSKVCPVCLGSDVGWFAAARDVEYQTGDERYDYWRCGGCRSVFLLCPPVGRLREIYPPHYYAYGPDGRGGLLEAVKRALDRRLLKKLLRRIPGAELAVLDVGGGSGWMLSLARQASARVRQTHVVDIDPEARGPAEAAGHVYHQARIEEFRCERRFDLILMLNLIEHVADPAAVLTSMRRLLSPRGRLVIKTPNIDTWDQRLFRHRNWGGFHCPRHWVLFTAESFTSLAARCGLETERIKYTQGAPQWTASILGVLAQRGWIHPRRDAPLLSHPLGAPLMAATAAVDLLRSPVARTAQMFITLKTAGRPAPGVPARPVVQQVGPQHAREAPPACTTG